MSIGERILQLRKENHLSQGQLAQSLEVSRQAVSKWENDLALPDSSKMILLAQVLDTDVEYLTTGRNSYARRPPIVLKETVEVEKIIEKPVVKVVEKVIPQVVEKPVVTIVEKPVPKKIYRTRYVRNPMEYALIAAVFFAVGFLLGRLL